MRLIFLLTLTLLSPLSKVMAQHVEIFDVLSHDNYMAKVKLVDEFMSRFNGVEQHPDFKDEDKKILALFDLSKITSMEDSLYNNAKEFAQIVQRDSIKLDFCDSLWFARVHCIGKLQGKPVDFHLRLRTERRESTGMYKWTVFAAEGRVFATSREHEHKELFIMPNDHEQFFASLYRVTTEAYRFIDDYATNGYIADPLSVFLTLVRTHQLIIEQIDNVHFFFRQVPGYLFTIKYFDRESKNAGWLIDTCVKL